MLTSSGSGAISPIGRAKTYYAKPRRGAAARAAAGPNYDSATFSSAGERSSFQMQMVSRVAQEVRTATTTGDIQELRQSVQAGEYTPDPMAIAAKILFLTEE